jgi:predicted RecA/RadA family phage recombinase
MGTSYLQPGDVLEFTAPSGGVTVGVPVLIAGLPLVPTATVAEASAFQGHAVGVHTLPKTTTETWVVGQPAFWDAANSKVSNDPTVGHLPIGLIAAAGTSSDTTGTVRLNGESLSGRMFTIRKRFTVAQVNAGATLLPAIAGAKYRMVAATAISIGGAAGAVTTVDILATLSSSSRKLVAFAQASLTQSTVLKDGGTGATVLADGASYTANDAGTAVTVGKTGADVTVATHIDVSLTYMIE